ncbi:MAG: membrane dipeptidase [Verrucomicrobiae bacterium]|nr:membrane dipeptidase [Verrucomicrobiae bacterium]
MNAKIQQCRKAAESILKPSPGQTEHGLELHAASVVFDAYGFAPNSAVDGGGIKDKIEKGLSDEGLRDLIEEMHMTRCLTDGREREECRQAWEASGVTCIFQNAGVENNALPQVLKRFARFTHVTDVWREMYVRAAMPDDIPAAKRQGKHCLYLTTNAVPFHQAWNTVADELQPIRMFFQMGCRMMHLTYNRRNMLGDGCAEPANGGLSDFGRAAIAEMNRAGVIVDVAHSGWQTSLEAAKISKAPVVASHSVCCALNPHVRGKPDDVIRAIVERNGYIGITCVPAFLGGKGDVRSFLDHIDHVVKKFGVDHVAIGTDHSYQSSQEGEEWKKIPKISRPNPATFANFWPPNDPIFDPQWRKDFQVQSLAWTNWPLFTVGLVQRGYSDADIQKIIGGNVLRVIRECWEGREEKLSA